MSNSSTESRYYQWTAFPMGESPMKGVLFWAVVVLTLWAVYWNIGSLLLTAAAALMLLGSLTSFFLRTTYSIDNKGAALKRFLFNRRIEWSRVRSVNDEQGGIFLSPFPVKSRLENFRGIFLPYRDNKVDVLEAIRLHIPDVDGLPQIEIQPVEHGNTSQIETKGTEIDE